MRLQKLIPAGMFLDLQRSSHAAIRQRVWSTSQKLLFILTQNINILSANIDRGTYRPARNQHGLTLRWHQRRNSSLPLLPGVNSRGS
jgi:hypothetical protein